MRHDAPYELKSEKFEELIHFRQHNGKFGKSIERIKNDPRFPGVIDELEDFIAMEIHAKTLLVKHSKMLGIGIFNKAILNWQLRNLWKGKAY